jgi:ABC-type multidrug transport system fused ATPase/permease subunit
MGAVISGTFAERSSKIDRPPIYYNKSFIQLINLLLIPMVILFIVLMILDWKITLIVTLIAWLLGGRILRRISEFIIVLPLYKLIIKEK